MAVTIKDVAALAGVSPSTVSRTCKNNPSISEETKERVRKAMAELGYEPNFQASNLASQNSRTIGIILPASAKEVYENSFYLEAIQGISHYCNGRQYMTTIVTGQDEAEILDAVRSMSRSGKVDGFIILYSKKDDPVIDYLFNEGLLYILIGKATQYTNQTIYIDNDNLLAGREAAEYLYQLGHRRIAYLGSDSSLMFSADRKAGYQLALASHQLPVRPEYCVEVKNVSENNEEAIRGLLMQKDRPTAILVSDDILAVSLERVCLENHLAIPEDLSIIGYNNSMLVNCCDPELTSIDNKLETLCQHLITTLMGVLGGNEMPKKTVFSGELVKRGTTK